MRQGMGPGTGGGDGPLVDTMEREKTKDTCKLSVTEKNGLSDREGLTRPVAGQREKVN